MSRRRVCPDCGARWTLQLPRGAAHRPWHDDPRCAGCRTAALVESIAVAVETVRCAEREAAQARTLTAAAAPEARAKAWESRRRNDDAVLSTEGSMALPVPHGPWVADALCAQVDTDLFFPEKGGSSTDAKAVCAVCPVLEPCREWAVEVQPVYGIWGGLSVKERRRLRLEAAS